MACVANSATVNTFANFFSTMMIFFLHMFVYKLDFPTQYQIQINYRLNIFIFYHKAVTYLGLKKLSMTEKNKLSKTLV